MVKAFLCLVMMSLVSASHALQVNSYWDQNFQKSLSVDCALDNKTAVCRRLCGQEKCVVKEKVCRNCLGRDILISHSLQEIGRNLQINRKSQVDEQELIKFLKQKSFISLTSKSIYNLLYRFNSRLFQNQFKSLCPKGDAEGTVIFFARQKTGEIGQGRYVFCHSQFFPLVYETQVNVAAETD